MQILILYVIKKGPQNILGIYMGQWNNCQPVKTFWITWRNYRLLHVTLPQDTSAIC